MRPGALIQIRGAVRYVRERSMEAIMSSIVIPNVDHVDRADLARLARVLEGQRHVIEALRCALASVVDRITELERTTAHQPSSTSVRRMDRELLTALADVVGHRVFTARELHQHAVVTGGVLAEALDRAGIRTTRALGKALRRLARHEGSGLRLARVGSDRDGALWCVRVS